MRMWILIVLGLIAAAVAWGVSLYNRMIGLDNASDGAWSDIDVQLKRRHELVPNLVETVKGYASHEKSTFEDVVAARSQASQASGPEAQAQAESQLTRTLRQLFALSERYPELKANQNFLSLQAELSKLEEAIQNARRYYNAVVRDLNTMTEQFPSVLVARRFGIGKREYFELDDADERSAPQVAFTSGS